jgi:spermidine/putrescine transport system substrate-binding protein
MEAGVMKASEFRNRLADGTLSRRQFNRALAAAGLTAVTVPLVPRRARADEQATYFTWSGYDDAGFFPGYVKKHGVNPNTPIFADEEEAFQKMRAGGTFDVVHPCNNSLPRWQDAGVIQAIDTSRLSNWPDVFDELKTFDGAQRDGQQYFVPVDWGNTSIIYRTDLVDIPEESWTLMWDERYKGKLSMAAAAEETIPIAAVVAGAADPFNLTDEEMAKVKDLLIKQKPLLRFYWDTNTTIEEGLASGELVASTGWNSSAVTLKGQGVAVKFMNPKEGIFTYCCGLVLAKDAPNVDKAHDLMDAMIAPDAGKWLVEVQGYGHSNRKTFELVGDAMLAERGLPKDPSAFLNNGIMFKPNQRLEEISSLFESVKAGI